MNLIKIEVRLTLSATFIIFAIASFLLIDKIGALSSILFILSAVCLFYVFVVSPRTLQRDISMLKDQFTLRSREYQRIYYRQKERVERRAYERTDYWLGVALILFLVGILCLLIYRFQEKQQYSDC